MMKPMRPPDHIRIRMTGRAGQPLTFWGNHADHVLAVMFLADPGQPVFVGWHPPAVERPPDQPMLPTIMGGVE